MKNAYLLICFWLLCNSAGAQYAPQAGLPGSDAIPATSNRFVNWAANCTIKRGLMNIADASLGYASAGDSTAALGAADNGIVSLGDSGVAVVTFAKPIYDGPGADFAVFENGFINTANDSESYMELAFVEVTSDGINYFRFPASSNTQINVQTGNGNYLNACNINNLAGKYIAMYGTPFDLQELVGTAGLDINHVTHIRIVDVVGSIFANASHDFTGRAINDPYPTPFPSGGFDLDAVGVIHNIETSVRSVTAVPDINVFPNPASDKITVSAATTNSLTAALSSLTGVVLQQKEITPADKTIQVSQYPAGMYYLILQDASGNKWSQIVTKR